MSSELVYRMRTCAAAILASKSSGNPWDTTLVATDAADLLAEASNLLDGPDDQHGNVDNAKAAARGEPVEVLQPVREVYRGGGVWTNMELPAATPRPCPSCGNIGARKVRISHRKLLLTCPMCSHEWEYA